MLTGVDSAYHRGAGLVKAGQPYVMYFTSSGVLWRGFTRVAGVSHRSPGASRPFPRRVPSRSQYLARGVERLPHRLGPSPAPPRTSSRATPGPLLGRIGELRRVGAVVPHQAHLVLVGAEAFPEPVRNRPITLRRRRLIRHRDLRVRVPEPRH